MTRVSPTSPGSGNRQQILFGLLALALGGMIIWMIVLANRGELNSDFGFLNWVPWGDKVGHFFLMGILSLLVNLSCRAKRLPLGGWKVLMGSVIVAVLVTAEELSQAYLPHRTLSLSDWLADMAGILLFGQVAVWIVAKKRWVLVDCPAMSDRQ